MAAGSSGFGFFVPQAWQQRRRRSRQHRSAQRRRRHFARQPSWPRLRSPAKRRAARPNATARTTLPPIARRTSNDRARQPPGRAPPPPVAHRPPPCAPRQSAGRRRESPACGAARRIRAGCAGCEPASCRHLLRASAASTRRPGPAGMLVIAHQQPAVARCADRRSREPPRPEPPRIDDLAGRSEQQCPRPVTPCPALTV